MIFSGVTGGAGFLPSWEPPTGGLYRFLVYGSFGSNLSRISRCFLRASGFSCLYVIYMRSSRRVV